MQVSDERFQAESELKGWFHQVMFFFAWGW
jgi:hypothetical protein